MENSKKKIYFKYTIKHITYSFIVTHSSCRETHMKRFNNLYWLEIYIYRKKRILSFYVRYKREYEKDCLFSLPIKCTSMLSSIVTPKCFSLLILCTWNWPSISWQSRVFKLKPSKVPYKTYNIYIKHHITSFWETLYIRHIHVVLNLQYIYWNQITKIVFKVFFLIIVILCWYYFSI